MGVNRYNQMKDLISIKERVNKLFEDILESDESDIGSQGTWSPLVDIYETDGEFVVKAELPEVRQEDLEIKVEGNVITIRGERKFHKDVQSSSYHRVERKYGVFKRAFRLPAMVAGDDIRASLVNGILKIVLPKREGSGSGPMRIEIS